MRLTYRLSEQDFLNCHLFFTSRSEATRKARKRNRLLMPGIYIVLGLATLFIGDPILSGLLIVAGVLWYFFFPGYEGKRIATRIQKHLQENLRSQFDQETNLDITKEMIIDKVNTLESRIPASEIKEIYKVPGYYYFLTKTGTAIIIPRNILEDESTLNGVIQEMCDDLKLPYREFAEWKWK